MDHETPSDSLVELAPGVSVHKTSLRYRFDRASGPGGQAVNKVNTKATLRVSLSDIQGMDDPALERLRGLAGSRLNKSDEIVLQSDSSRSQLDNREACLTLLRGMIKLAIVPPKPRKRKKPTRAMIKRRLEEKRRQSKKKQARRKPDPD